MLLRMLLILIAVVGLSLTGCKKEEPTPQDVVNEMKEDVEEAAEEAQPVAEEAAKEAEKAAEELKK